MASPKVLQTLIEHFQRFPGIGPRQAQRFVYALLDTEGETVLALAAALRELKDTVLRCQECWRACSPDDSKRTNTNMVCVACKNTVVPCSILVVEKDQDCEAVEKSGAYQGLYHVLGGLIDPLKKSSVVQERIKKLHARVKKFSASGMCEVITAFAANIEGDSTALYIERILEPFIKTGKVAFSRFGRGLSTGSELEYADPQTLRHALENRK